MANYECTIRTNYFHVTDEEAFKALMCRVYGTERPVNVFTDTDANGATVFGFGTYGAIAGLKNAQCDDDDDVDESAYDEFIDELKKCIAEDDACIIFEAGAEKLRYVIGTAHVITAHEERWINLQNAAIETAKLMLGNPNFATKCDY
jgi:hypothetical protein